MQQSQLHYLTEYSTHLLFISYLIFQCTRKLLCTKTLYFSHTKLQFFIHTIQQGSCGKQRLLPTQEGREQDRIQPSKKVSSKTICLENVNTDLLIANTFGRCMQVKQRVGVHTFEY